MALVEGPERAKTEAQLAGLRRELEMLETGQMGTHAVVLGSTTSETIHRLKSTVAEFERILADPG